MAKANDKRDDIAEALVGDAIEAARRAPRPDLQQPSDVMKAHLRRGEQIARSGRATSV